MKRERGQRGQALVEAALFVPVVFLLLFGTYDLSTWASDKVQSYSAVRHGVRIASQLGGIPNNPGFPTQVCSGTLPLGTSVTSIDAQIVQVVLAATANMSYVTLNEIDIYQPGNADGSYVPGTDKANKYDGKGVMKPGGNFLLNQRCQGPLGASPKDTSVGVQLVWTYTAPNGLGFGRGPITFANLKDYSVEKMQQCAGNCLPF